MLRRVTGRLLEDEFHFVEPSLKLIVVMLNTLAKMLVVEKRLHLRLQHCEEHLFDLGLKCKPVGLRGVVARPVRLLLYHVVQLSLRKLRQLETSFKVHARQRWNLQGVLFHLSYATRTHFEFQLIARLRLLATCRRAIHFLSRLALYQFQLVGWLCGLGLLR